MGGPMWAGLGHLVLPVLAWMNQSNQDQYKEAPLLTDTRYFLPFQFIGMKSDLYVCVCLTAPCLALRV